MNAGAAINETHLVRDPEPIAIIIIVIIAVELCNSMCRTSIALVHDARRRHCT